MNIISGDYCRGKTWELLWLVIWRDYVWTAGTVCIAPSPTQCWINFADVDPTLSGRWVIVSRNPDRKSKLWRDVDRIRSWFVFTSRSWSHVNLVSVSAGLFSDPSGRPPSIQPSSCLRIPDAAAAAAGTAAVAAVCIPWRLLRVHVVSYRWVRLVDLLTHPVALIHITWRSNLNSHTSWRIGNLRMMEMFWRKLLLNGLVSSGSIMNNSYI